MKSTIRRLGFLSLLWVACPAQGQDFFLTSDFGYSGIFYGSNPTLQNFAATQQGATTRHLPLALDIAFLMRVFDEGSAVGLGYDGILDIYSRSGAGNRGAINQTNVVGTLRHFFGDAVGQGPFLRGDIGMDFVSLSTTSTNNVFDTSSTTSTTYRGLSLLGGAGYGLHVSDNVSITFEGDFGRTSLIGGTISVWQPKVGVFISL